MNFGASNSPYFDFLLFTSSGPYGSIQVGDSLSYRALALQPSGGNVGIRTTTPSALLHVFGSATSDAFATFGVDAVTGPALNLGYGGASFGRSAAFFNVRADASATAPNPSLRFLTADVQRMIITNTGDVGIGTTAPQAKLHVYGTLRAQGIVDATTEYPASIDWITTGPSATTNRWAAFVGSATGSYGLVPNAWELYEYPPAANPVFAAVRISIRKTTTAAYKTFVLDGSGNVGIGTAVPSEALHVMGNIRASGNISADGVINAKYQDVAEWVPSDADLDAGTVVVLSQSGANRVTASSIPYDTGVAGVVSAQPGIVLGVGGEEKEQVATTGRVKVKVDASRAPIRIGDLLVTSDRPGYAMKSRPVDLGGVTIHRPGTIIGKALEPLENGDGEILVLLSLQ